MFDGTVGGELMWAIDDDDGDRVGNGGGENDVNTNRNGGGLDDEGGDFAADSTPAARKRRRITVRWKKPLPDANRTTAAAPGTRAPHATPTNPIPVEPSSSSTSSPQYPLQKEPNSVDTVGGRSVAALEARSAELSCVIEQKLSALGITAEQVEKIISEHINRLHRYNEIKDCGQLAFGLYAEMRGETVKQAYRQFAIDEAD